MTTKIRHHDLHEGEIKKVYALVHNCDYEIEGVYSDRELAEVFNQDENYNILEFELNAQPTKIVRKVKAEERRCDATPPSFEVLQKSIYDEMEKFIQHYNAGRNVKARVHTRHVLQDLESAKMLGYDFESLERDIDRRLRLNADEQKQKVLAEEDWKEEVRVASEVEDK